MTSSPGPIRNLCWMTRATDIAPIASASAAQNAAAIHFQRGLRSSITVPSAAAALIPSLKPQKVKGHELGPRSSGLVRARRSRPARTARFDLNNLLLAIDGLRS